MQNTNKIYRQASFALEIYDLTIRVYENNADCRNFVKESSAIFNINLKKDYMASNLVTWIKISIGKN